MKQQVVASSHIEEPNESKLGRLKSLATDRKASSKSRLKQPVASSALLLSKRSTEDKQNDNSKNYESSLKLPSKSTPPTAQTSTVISRIVRPSSLPLNSPSSRAHNFITSSVSSNSKAKSGKCSFQGTQQQQQKSESIEEPVKGVQLATKTVRNSNSSSICSLKRKVSTINSGKFALRVSLLQCQCCLRTKVAAVGHLDVTIIQWLTLMLLKPIIVQVLIRPEWPLRHLPRVGSSLHQWHPQQMAIIEAASLILPPSKLD